MRNKTDKTAAINFIVIIIFLLVVLVVLIGFQTKLFGLYKEKIPKDICKTDVLLNSALRFNGIVFSSKLRCPTQEINIKGSDETAIKSRLANALYDCWDQFGEGKLELFKDNGLFCAVCSVVRFDDKNLKIGHFSDYLLVTKLPGQQITYEDYLQGHATPKAAEYYNDPSVFNRNAPALADEIDASKIYSVVFAYGRGEDAIDSLKTYFGAETAVAGAGIAGGVAGGLVAVFVLGSNPVGWVTAGLIAVGGAVSAGIALFTHEPPEWMALAFLQEHSKEKFKKLPCDFLPAEQAIE